MLRQCCDNDEYGDNDESCDSDESCGNDECCVRVAILMNVATMMNVAASACARNTKTKLISVHVIGIMQRHNTKNVSPHETYACTLLEQAALQHEDSALQVQAKTKAHVGI